MPVMVSGDPSAGRLALVSLHTCPLASPGAEDAGGMNVYIRMVAKVIATRGVAVDIFTRSLRHGSEACAIPVERGVRLVRLPAGPVATAKDSLRPWVDPFAAHVIAFARREGTKYRGIVSQYWLSGLVGNLLRETWGARHVAGFHTLELAKWGAMPIASVMPGRVAGERAVVAGADRILATTRHEIEVLATRYDAEPARIRLAPPAADAATFHPLDRIWCRQRLGFPLDRSLALFVGRLIPLKGIDLLLHAVARMPKQRNLAAVIVGGTIGSQHHRDLEELAGELGIADRIHFAGPVAHEMLPLYYGAADVCAVPSYYESFGMVALEAMACGCPVVASRVGGLESLIAEGHTGLLMEPGTVDDCCRAMNALLSDAMLRESIRQGGICVARRYTWDATADSILGSLEAVATRGAA